MTAEPTSRDLAADLREVGEQTLQALAFLFPCEADEVEEASGEMARTRVDFAGPVTGSLLVTVPAQLLGPLTANMLGLPECAGPGREQELDALKELSNVVCGNLLPMIAGRDAVFRIAAPRVVTDGWAGEVTATAWIAVDEGWARLELALDQPAATAPAAAGGAGA